MGSMGWARVCHPSILRMVVWPEASRAQRSIGTVSAQGSTVWVLIRRRNSSFSRWVALVVRAAFHCVGARRVGAGESEQAICGLFKAVSDRAALDPPFAQECLPALFHFRRRFGIDHVAIVVTQLLVHMLRGMG